jgi:hypothetical protein
MSQFRTAGTSRADRADRVVHAFRGQGLPPITALLLVALSIAALVPLAGCSARFGLPVTGGPSDPAAATSAGGGAGTDANGAGAGAGGAAGSAGGLAVPVSASNDPGPGTVIGRLIDGVTGQAVRDAGVSLLELGKRTITVPDGRFRFDGVAPGVYTLVAGPAAGYVPSSLQVRVLSNGTNTGLVALGPAEPATLIMPEYGGKVAACGTTQVLFPTATLMEATPIQLTCITRAEAFPAPAPAGRLPLAVVDLAPGELALVNPARLRVDLPAQPHYGPGVKLDLLRLDLDRLVWVPTTTLSVDAGGRTASGQISALGTYLAAAPPFGTFMAAPGDGPALTRLNTAAAPQGSPSADFPLGTAIVYLSFDYARMADTPVQIRTVSPEGEVQFEIERRYTGEGRDDIPMAAGSSAWPAGSYITTVYIGSPPDISSLDWRVAAPTPEPATPTLPAVGPRADAGLESGAVAQAVFATDCTAPGSWYAYAVQPGDTLYGLALSTGVDIATLAQANCLKSQLIRAGQTLFVPSVPGTLPGYSTWPGTNGWPAYGSWSPTKPIYPGWPNYGSYPPILPPYVKPTPLPKPPIATEPPPIWTAEPPLPGGGLPGGGLPENPLPWYTPPAPFPGQPFKPPLSGEPTLAPRPVYPPIEAPQVNPSGGAPPGGWPPAGPPPQGRAPAAQPPVQPAPVQRPPAEQPPVNPAPPSGGSSKGPRGPEPTLAPRPMP